MGQTPFSKSCLKMLMAAVLSSVLTGGFVMTLVSAVQAQSTETVRSPILVVDSEQLYVGSAFGKRVARDQSRLSAALVAENVEIEQELSAQEQSLTERRATTPAADFRKLADEFDAKVQATRSRQLGKTQALTQLLEQQQVVFLQSAGPVLENLMRDAGAAVLLDRRNVFFSADAVDVTGAAILRIDATLGEGAPLAAPKNAPPVE
jgi:Skp family chaperone for outer membrane proteins